MSQQKLSLHGSDVDLTKCLRKTVLVQNTLLAVKMLVAGEQSAPWSSESEEFSPVTDADSPVEQRAGQLMLRDDDATAGPAESPSAPLRLTLRVMGMPPTPPPEGCDMLSVSMLADPDADNALLVDALDSDEEVASVSDDESEDALSSKVAATTAISRTEADVQVVPSDEPILPITPPTTPGSGRRRSLAEMCDSHADCCAVSADAPSDDGEPLASPVKRRRPTG